MSSMLDQFSSERLTPSEEAVLALEIIRGSEEALVKLVMANMHEALRYTQRVCNDRIDEPTRVSLCYQEMTMSGRRYRSGRTRFFAFAKAGLRGRMKTYWRSLNTVRNAKEIISCESIEHFQRFHGRNNFVKQTMAFPERHRAEVLPAEEEEDDHEESLREVVTGEVEMPNVDAFMAKDHWEAIQKKFRKTISEQQWMILDLAYRGNLNFPQIGKLLGLTRSAIHASHRNAIKRLRGAIRLDQRLLL